MTVTTASHAMWTSRPRAGVPVFTDADLPVCADSGTPVTGYRGPRLRLESIFASS